jgi:ribosome-binding protein aMBF1 (putative translation factor)
MNDCALCGEEINGQQGTIPVEDGELSLHEKCGKEIDSAINRLEELATLSSPSNPAFCNAVQPET